MEEGLFPKSSKGWFVFIVLALAYYFVYYSAFYARLYDTYIGRYDTPGLQSDSSNGVDVFVRMPKHISEFVERSLLVTVRNKSGMTIERMVISVVPASDAENFVDVSAVRSNLGLISPSEGNLLPSHILFETIPPSATVSGVFYIYAKNVALIPEKNGERIITLDFYQDANKLGIDTEMRYDTWKAFQHSLTEIILLPPWSNGLLGIAALVVVKLIEDSLDPTLKNNDVESLPHNKRLIASTILALGLSIVFFAGIIVASGLFTNPESPPFTPDWIGILTAIVGAIILVVGYLKSTNFIWKRKGPIAPSSNGPKVSAPPAPSGVSGSSSSPQTTAPGNAKTPPPASSASLHVPSAANSEPAPRIVPGVSNSLTDKLPNSAEPGEQSSLVAEKGQQAPENLHAQVTAQGPEQTAPEARISSGSNQQNHLSEKESPADAELPPTQLPGSNLRLPIGACPTCGAEIMRDDAIFCWKCSKPLHPTSQMPTDTIHEPESKSAPDEASTQNTERG